MLVEGTAEPTGVASDTAAHVADGVVAKHIDAEADEASKDCEEEDEKDWLLDKRRLEVLMISFC